MHYIIEKKKRTFSKTCTFILCQKFNPTQTFHKETTLYKSPGQEQAMSPTFQAEPFTAVRNIYDQLLC